MITKLNFQTLKRENAFKLGKDRSVKRGNRVVASYPVAALVVLMEFIKIRVKSASGLVRPLSTLRTSFRRFRCIQRAVASFSRKYCASITLISKYRDRRSLAARRDKTHSGSGRATSVSIEVSQFL